MSIGAHSISEAPVAGQDDPTKNGKDTTPRKRMVIATSDAVARPEAR